MAFRPRRILWPTDFSDLSLVGGRYARDQRELYDAELHILHAVPPPMAPDVAAVVPAEVPVPYSDQELIDACRETLDRVVAEHFKDVPHLVREVRFGNPWSTICTYAEEREIELIVLATHGRTGLSHVLIGSTAERIVQHAPCPVLVIKQRADKSSKS